MTESTSDDLKRTIISKLDVLEDDIHVTDNAITFYLPPAQIDKAENVLGRKVEILEDHGYEKLVKINL